jgi:co-chaperonin GroES (HSP10)
MNLHPLGSRVLIKRKEITKLGNLFLPVNSKEAECNIGEIIAVGPECTFLEVGYVVTFGRYAPLRIFKDEMEIYGIKINMDSDSAYLLMNEEDVLCVISEDTPVRSEIEEEVA